MDIRMPSHMDGQSMHRAEKRDKCKNDQYLFGCEARPMRVNINRGESTIPKVLVSSCSSYFSPSLVNMLVV